MGTRIDNQRQAISDKLKAIRKDRGYSSYEKFANENELDRKQYWRIEENETNITLNSLLRLLEIHDMTLEEFFKGL